MVKNTKGQELFAGLRKAAIVLISLGDQAAGELLRQLPEEDVQLVSQELRALQRSQANRPRWCWRSSTS